MTQTVINFDFILTEPEIVLAALKFLDLYPRCGTGEFRGKEQEKKVAELLNLSKKLYVSIPGLPKRFLVREMFALITDHEADLLKAKETLHLMLDDM